MARLLILAMLGMAACGVAHAQTAKEKKTIAAHAKKLDFWQLCGEAGRALRNPSRTANGKYWQRIVLDRANIPAEDHRYIRERRLHLGMDECSVVAIFGKPDALNPDGSARGRELVYRQRGVSVYTDNGAVRAWEE